MMQLCMNEASILAHGDVLSHIRDCAETGLTGMELRKASLFRYFRSGGSLEELKRTLQDCSIEPVCLGAVEQFSFHTPRGFKAVLESCEYFCYISRSIGCDCVEVIASPDVGTDDWETIETETVSALTRLSDTASHYGVRLALEYMGVNNGSVPTFEKALSIVRRTGRENVGLLADTWHHYAAGSPVGDISMARPEEIFIVHTSDCPSCEPGTLPRSESYMPGDGAAPIVPILRELNGIGYDGVLSIETFLPAYAEMPVRDYLREVSDKTRAVMREAGVL